MSLTQYSYHGDLTKYETENVMLQNGIHFWKSKIVYFTLIACYLMIGEIGKRTQRQKNTATLIT